MPVKSHDYQPLEVMQEDLRRSLRNLMINIVDRAQRLNKEEKKVSLIMDRVEEQCREMRKAIETQKNQQVVLLSCIVLLQINNVCSIVSIIKSPLNINCFSISIMKFVDVSS